MCQLRTKVDRRDSRAKRSGTPIPPQLRGLPFLGGRATPKRQRFPWRRGAPRARRCISCAVASGRRRRGRGCRACRRAARARSAWAAGAARAACSCPRSPSQILTECGLTTICSCTRPQAQPIAECHAPLRSHGLSVRSQPVFAHGSATGARLPCLRARAPALKSVPSRVRKRGRVSTKANLGDLGSVLTVTAVCSDWPRASACGRRCILKVGLVRWL